MARDVLTLNLKVGIAAALLTFFEYLLSTIAAFSARAAIHGVFLLNLHRGGNAPLDARARSRRTVRKELLSFCLSIILVIGVALLESSLAPGVAIEKQFIDTTKCISVNSVLDRLRIYAHKPPFGVTVETWVLQTAERIECPYGIQTIGLSARTDKSGEKTNMTSPMCVKEKLHLSEIDFHMKDIHLAQGYFSPLFDAPGFYILPHKSLSMPLGKSISELYGSADGTLDCEKLGISNFFLAPPTSFETRDFHVLNVTFAIHQLMCRLHRQAPYNVIDAVRVQKCRSNNAVANKIQIGGQAVRQREIETGGIKLHCLVGIANSEEVYSIELRDVAALFFSGEEDGKSYVCLNTTLRVEYIFIDAQPPNNTRGQEKKRSSNGVSALQPVLPVLLPTRLTAVDGFCQRTIAPVAQAALFYTLESEWSDNELGDLSPVARYYAYMITVACSLFPLAQLPPPERSTEVDGSCLVHPVRIVTFVAKGWRLAFLGTALTLAGLIVATAVLCRCFFTGESWSVGSAHWSLSRLLENEGRVPDTMIEFVPVPVDNGNELPSRENILGPVENIASVFSTRILRLDATSRNAMYQYRVTGMGGRRRSASYRRTVSEI